MWITPEPRYFDTFINCLESSPSDKIIHLGLDVPTGFQGIVYNTEQLTIPRILTKILRLVELAPKLEVPKLELWDYSMVNIRILANHGIIAKYMPLKTSGPYLEKLQRFITSTKVYDIGFNGSMSARRKTILDQLATSFTVFISTSWGDTRDLELSQCRVLVNIHFDTNYMVFESARCEPWLSVGIPVISELSIDNDERCILTTYDGFLKTVTDYFQNKNQSLK
jgi:hypothetical protein